MFQSGHRWAAVLHARAALAGRDQSPPSGCPRGLIFASHGVLGYPPPVLSVTHFVGAVSRDVGAIRQPAGTCGEVNRASRPGRRTLDASEPVARRNCAGPRNQLGGSR